jgi:DNA topoisomerase-2
VDLRKKSAEEVVHMMESAGFDLVDGDYKYLTKMPMDSVTKENVAKIIRECEDTERDFKKLEATALEEIWRLELEHLKTEYLSYKTKRGSAVVVLNSKGAKKVAKKPVKNAK